MSIRESKLLTPSVSRYRADENQEVITGWLHGHGMSPSLVHSLPQIGVLAQINNIPRAAAFLRLVEGRMGLLDGLIVDPSIRRHERNMAIDAAVKGIIHEAYSINLIRIVAWSSDICTLVRSRKHGFERMKESLIDLRL